MASKLQFLQWQRGAYGQQRNQVQNQQPHHSIDQLSRVAAEWLAEFVATQPTTPTRAVQISRIQRKTQPPNSFKVNYDGAACSSSNCSGIGVVIRDHDGLVIASLAQNLCESLQTNGDWSYGSNPSHWVCYRSKLAWTELWLKGIWVLLWRHWGPKMQVWHHMVYSLKMLNW